MARFTILYWEDIPSVVEASENGETKKVELSQRFQELIDKVAMRKGLFGTDSYLEKWRKSKRKDRPGSAVEVATEIAAELENRYQMIEEKVMAAANLARQQSNQQDIPPASS